MTRFYLDPYTPSDELPDGVALKCLVKTSGDPVGVLYIGEDGGFAFWRNGSCWGTFDTLTQLYRKLDKADV